MKLELIQPFADYLELMQYPVNKQAAALAAS